MTYRLLVAMGLVLTFLFIGQEASASFGHAVPRSNHPQYRPRQPVSCRTCVQTRAFTQPAVGGHVQRAVRGGFVQPAVRYPFYFPTPTFYYWHPWW